MSHLRVAVLSDIHGNYHALTSVLEDIQQQGIEKIICAGDSTGQVMQNQVFKTLIEKNAIMIRGNGENRIVQKNRGKNSDNTWNQKMYSGNRWIYNDLEPAIRNFLEFLPEQRVIKFEDTSPIRVVHGSPKDTWYANGILPEQTSIDSKNIIRVHRTISIEDAVENLKESVLICGHTHRPWIHYVDDVLVVNPGSVGNPCDGDPRADYSVLTWMNDRWSVEQKAVSYDLELEINEFHERGILETVGAFARATLLGRMTGVDVALEFLLYVKELTIQSEEFVNYEHVYSAAVNSFDWGKYENEK